MKKVTIPKMLVLGVFALVATTALAAQVKLVNLSGGAGSSAGTNYQMSLVLGQGIAGRADEVAGNNGARIGVWEILNQTHVVSPVGEEPPVARNQLFRNYPNPFNPSTRISFTLAKEAEVRIDLYDLKGRKVDTLLREIKPAGAHSFTYQPKNLASGVYLVLMRAGSFRASQRMMLVK